MTSSCIRRLVVLVLGAGLAAAEVRASQAQPQFVWWRSDEFKKELALTADQISRIDKIFESTRPELRQEMDELSRRERATTDAAQRWSREAQDEFEAKRIELQKAGLEKVRDAIKQTASAQGYTIVFIADVAPYGANDLTADRKNVVDQRAATDHECRAGMPADG